MKSLYDAMLNPALFGGTFADPTFKAWRTVANALLLAHWALTRVRSLAA
jgi:hypothetical protein